MRLPYWIFWIGLLAASLPRPLLHSQTTGLSGFDLWHSYPPGDGSGLFFLHGAKTPLPWHLAVGLDLDFGHGFLAATNATTGFQVRVVDDMYRATASFALGLP